MLPRKIWFENNAENKSPKGIMPREMVSFCQFSDTSFHSIATFKCSSKARTKPSMYLIFFAS